MPLPPLKGIFAGGELRDQAIPHAVHAVQSARTHKDEDRDGERRSRRAAEGSAHCSPRQIRDTHFQQEGASRRRRDLTNDRMSLAPNQTAMIATYGRVMKQSLGEDDGGYGSKNRFDRPFHAADARLTVAPEVRATLDYLEDKVSLLGKSMRKMFEQINTRRDGAITKKEFMWLLNSFQLHVSVAAFERLWYHLDKKNAGQILFSDLMQLLDKSHDIRATHLAESAHLRTQVKLPVVSDYCSKSLGTAGLTAAAHAQRDTARTFEFASTWRGGRGGVPTLVDHFGDAHLSAGFDRSTRYVNQYPFHTGKTKAVLPEKVPHDAFKMDLTSRHPNNEQQFRDALAGYYRANHTDHRTERDKQVLKHCPWSRTDEYEPPIEMPNAHRGSQHTAHLNGGMVCRNGVWNARY